MCGSTSVLRTTASCTVALRIPSKNNENLNIEGMTTSPVHYPLKYSCAGPFATSKKTPFCSVRIIDEIAFSTTACRSTRGWDEQKMASPCPPCKFVRVRVTPHESDEAFVSRIQKCWKWLSGWRVSWWEERSMDYPLNRNVNLTFIIPTHLPHPFCTILSSSNGTLLLSRDFNSGIKPVEQIPRREWTMVSRDKDNFVVFRSLTHKRFSSLARNSAVSSCFHDA